MTDAPDGPTEARARTWATRPAGRRQRSPVGSTLSIVLAVLAVVAGFLILRAITDDDDVMATATSARSRPPGPRSRPPDRRTSAP